MVSMRVERRGSASEVLERLSFALEGPKQVKVGFPKGEVDQDIVARAAFNEFGTSRGIPERPFLRNAMRANRPDYRVTVWRGALAVIKGERDLRGVLELLGMKAVGDIQREIVSLSEPPNSPATIARKGSSNPLIDTGEMRQRVTHKVDD